LVALLLILFVAMGAILVRLSVLQVSQAGEYRTRAFDQRVRTVDLPAARGEILDANGHPLAISLEARDIYADARYVTDEWDEAAKIAPLLGLDVREIVRRLTAGTTFSYVARQVDLDVAKKIEAMNLPGLGFLPVSKRYYPAGTLAAQVLGFIGTDGTGLSGLELQFQSALAGTPGERTQELDPHGQPITGGIDQEQPPVAGLSVVTTIDRDFQYQVQVALEEAVKANHARGGTVIVMDPHTGDILAMATYPWFDPNDFAASPPETWRNRALTDAFEPGSVSKTITASAAVEERTLPLDQRLSIASTIQVGPSIIHDSHPHPIERMTLGDIIAQSSNVGAVQVAQLLGQDALASYIARFGFGQSTGTGFPGESAGITLPLADWSVTSLATMAYGQGIAVTPQQMTDVYSTIANGGTWVQPRLVKGTIDANGVYHAAPASPTRRVVSEQTAAAVTQMLAYAVQAGTGTAAQIPGYQVAGKTGTARIPAPHGGYITGKYFASFMGFLPASQPDVVIAAILDRPATIYGGVAAAPLFQEIARYAILRLGITPGNTVGLPPHNFPLP
jgi:cell division protein FtsI (penicillin-binding protein 3)